MTRAAEAWMRGAGPVAVLKVLDQRPMYGYELAEALDSRSDGVLALGHSTLYPLLYKLERQGLITQSESRLESGRKRKYYTTTEAGKERLRQHEEEWAGLVAAMGKLGLT